MKCENSSTVICLSVYLFVCFPSCPSHTGPQCTIQVSSTHSTRNITPVNDIINTSSVPVQELNLQLITLLESHWDITSTRHIVPERSWKWLLETLYWCQALGSPFYTSKRGQHSALDWVDELCWWEFLNTLSSDGVTNRRSENNLNHIFRVLEMPDVEYTHYSVVRI